MKVKMFLVSLVLGAVLIVAAVSAQEEEAAGIGLSAGVEFGLGDVVDKVVFSLAPQITYENSFLDGALDVFAEGIYAFAFDDEVGMEASLEEELGYNFFPGSASTLSIIVNNLNEFVLTPDEAKGVSGTFTPGVKYTHALGFGDLYGRTGLPVEYADFGLGLDLTAGMAAAFGFGAELTAHIALYPDPDYAGLDLILSYEAGNIYAEVEIDTGKDFRDIVIIPEFDYSFKALTFWVKAELGNINADAPVSFTPAIGVKYSF
ncbi:hypothetical protein FACS1894110_02470 [Spirochaetia bacterium]|nr:hypothetical protein FACS1894110_02470 [Spirochaetia bacterium]